MKRCWLLVFVFFTPVLAAQTDTLLRVTNQWRVYPLDGFIEVYEDGAESLTFEEVRQESFHNNFHLLEDPAPNDKSRRVYWLKTRFTAAADLTDWLLLLKNPAYENSANRSVYAAGNLYVEGYFILSNGRAYRRRDGFSLPKSRRTYYRQPLLNALPFSLAKGDTATVFIRVHNPGDPRAGLALELRPQALDIPFGRSGFAFSAGTWMGVSGALALLCFFFFLAGKDPANLFFSLSSLCLMLHYSLLHPEVLFVSWFIPEKPWLAEYAWILLSHGALFFFILFGRAFVNVKQYSRLLDHLMLGLAASLALLILLTTANHRFSWGVSPTGILVFIVASAMVIALRIGFFPGRLAKIFALGAVWLLFFTILGFLANAGYFRFFNPWPVGQLGLMVIYAYGLAYKLQLQEKAKSEAQRVLELDAVKSRFFANISHEFRTPLTLILGPLKKAQEQWPVSEQEAVLENSVEEISLPAHHIGMMRRNAERLQQLIDQLLDLSKLENGSMKLQVTGGDPVPFLRAMVFGFESLAERKQIHFQTAFPGAGGTAFFDKDKLEKIVVNLLSNAFKYTPERGLVSVLVVLENGRLKITIEDSGPGISKQELNKIFERFYQVEGTEDQGTGIGLSLVKELVELHRGQISVDSAPGKGTIFKVSLPVAKTAFKETEIVESAPSDALTGKRVSPLLPGFPADEPFPDPPSAGLPVLLIVEDNPDLRRFIGETMSGDFRIVTAENGKTGLALALEHTPDLIVSDVMMREMDGFELCRQLKTDEHTSHIPIILLTAKAEQQHKIEGLETGADDYLTKPFDETELMVRARNLIEQRKKWREKISKLPALKPSGVAINSAEERFLNKVGEAIEANLDNEFFSVEDLASAVAFSRSQLHRKLKALTGKSPTDHIREFRLTRAKELLEKGYGNVSEVAMEVGYSSLSYFTRSFKAEFGVLPSEV